MSFFNPELLGYIIETRGTRGNRVDFEKYKMKLDVFCKSIIIPPVFFSGEEQSLTLKKREEIKMKLDSNDRRLQRLRDVKSAIAKILHVKEVVLCLVSVKDGCTEVVFLVPQFVVQQVFPLSEDQARTISSIGVFNLMTTQGHHYNFSVRMLLMYTIYLGMMSVFITENRC